MEHLSDVARQIQTWFPDLLKNSFSAFSENYAAANNIEMPYAVVLPIRTDVIEQPSMRNQLSDFLLSESIKIMFYFDIKALRNKKGQVTPYWACLTEDKSISSVLYNNLSRYYYDRKETVHFEGSEYFCDTQGPILCYNYKREYCLSNTTSASGALISNIKLEHIVVSEING